MMDEAKKIPIILKNIDSPYRFAFVPADKERKSKNEIIFNGAICDISPRQLVSFTRIFLSFFRFHFAFLVFFSIGMQDSLFLSPFSSSISLKFSKIEFPKCNSISILISVQIKYSLFIN